MGLIKTSVVIAGGYAIIKAASKAKHEHDDRKQKRQGYPGSEQPQQMADGSYIYPPSEKDRGFPPQGQYQQYQPQHYGNGGPAMYGSQQQGYQPQTPPPYARKS